MLKLTQKIVKTIFKPRDENSHKGNHGHALIIAGNIGKMGAAVISAKACLRSGVGLLTVNIPIEERFILQTSLPEAMLNFKGELYNNFENYSAIGIGPGIGLIDSKIIETIFKKSIGALLLDADALNILAVNQKLFNIIPPQTILTPHPKEFDRLFGIHENFNDRLITAELKAKQHNIVIILKGAQTIITYNGITYINSTGNAGLAKAGSGDALSGIITALLAQGYEPFKAAQMGVYLHGLAADLSLKIQSVESLLITDVIENIGSAIKSLY
jgi:NAD(P)H-hydrate epimerase